MSEPVFESLAQVTLHVEDLDEARTFYRDILGLEVDQVDEEMDFAQFRAPGGTPIGLHVPAPGEQGQDPGGPTGLFFRVEDCAQAARELEDRGGRIVEKPSERPWGAVVASVADPSGNELMFFELVGDA